MDRRWRDGHDGGCPADYHHHHWNDGGRGLQARREARKKEQGSFSLGGTDNPRPSPTSVTSLFNMSPATRSPSSLFADPSLLGEGSSHHLRDHPLTLNESEHKSRLHHDSLFQQSSSHSSAFYDSKPRSIPGSTSISMPGAHMMSNTFDAISRKMAAFDDPTGTSEKHIEISPGHTERLRGANETWHCIENDFFMPCQCFCCGESICCIMDATYVLCPTCKVVIPLDNGCNGGGVGLGFTHDDLQKWQTEIILSRR